MPLTSDQKREIKNLLRNSIREKIEKRSEESDSMPFHSLLFGADRLAVYRFMHSMNTSIGMSMYEPLAKIVAREKFDSAEIQCKAGNLISSRAQEVIQEIVDDLSTERVQVNKLEEIEKIRNVAKKGETRQIKLV